MPASGCTYLPGAEEYPIDCRSYEDFFVPCKVGPDAAKTVCGLAKMEDDATGTQGFARLVGVADLMNE